MHLGEIHIRFGSVVTKKRIFVKHVMGLLLPSFVAWMFVSLRSRFRSSAAVFAHVHVFPGLSAGRRLVGVACIMSAVGLAETDAPLAIIVAYANARRGAGVSLFPRAVGCFRKDYWKGPSLDQS